MLRALKRMTMFGVLISGLAITPGAYSQDPIMINEGLSGTWFNAATPGQGFLFDINDSTGIFFSGWFTYDPATAAKALGAEEHRWLILQGEFSGTMAELPVFTTTGGLFDDPATVETEQIGTATVSFSSCTEGRIDYQIESPDLTASGGFDIERITPDTFCQEIVDAQTPTVTLTYIGNDGVFVSDGDAAVLIDAVGDFGNFFVNVPAQTQAAILNIEPPFDQTVASLVTHNHGDHYNITPTINLLNRLPDAQLFISPQGRGAFSSLGSQVADITPNRFESEIRTIGGVSITTIATRHFNQFGNDFSGVDNYAFVVEISGKRVLHTGDIDYAADNFEAIRDAFPGDIDVIVLPTFNTLLSQANAALINQFFPESQVVAAHLRANNANDINAIQQFYPDAIIFDQPLESIEL